LAAFEHKRGSEFAPAIDLAVNAGATLNLLECCRSRGLKPRIVFASSANIYGQPTRLPVDESFPDQPLTLFAIHKLTSEQYLRFYAREFGIPSVSLRLSNLYGCFHHTSREVVDRVVLNRIMGRALRGDSLELYRNRDKVRDYLHIEDVVSALLAAA